MPGVKLPPRGHCGYLIDAACEIGLMKFSWQEAAAVASVSGYALAPMELSGIKTICDAYAYAVHKFDGVRCSPPWENIVPDDKPVTRSILARGPRR